jgi:hypothetical protein
MLRPSMSLPKVEKAPPAVGSISAGLPVSAANCFELRSSS